MSHWQDQCPYCGFIKNEHSINCSFRAKLARYEARKAAGEFPIVPEGISVVCDMDDLIETLGLTDKRQSE